MFKRMFDTRASSVGLILRVALGLIMLPHGLQMAFGWLGGGGLPATVDAFTGYQRFPLPAAVIGALTPLVASVLLILGCFGRLIALILGIFLLVAMLAVHLSVGFFMNRGGQLHGEGYEFHLLGIGIATSRMVTGSGMLTIDRRISRGLT